MLAKASQIIVSIRFSPVVESRSSITNFWLFLLFVPPRMLAVKSALSFRDASFSPFFALETEIKGCLTHLAIHGMV